MTGFNRIFTLWIISLILLSGAINASELTWIEADHPDISYTGRIDFEDLKSPRIFWPGTYLRTTFSGTSIKVVLDDELGQSYYHVIIDNNEKQPVIIDCQPGLHIYNIADNLQEGTHQLLLFRRTEAPTGATEFRGIILDKYAKILPVSSVPERKIEFYGNSITVGMGNEAPLDGGDDDRAHENNYMSYAAITARNLNADYTCIAKSGIGIMVSWFDLIMPNYYYRLDPDDPESKWNFSQSQPDVVVVNLFQNDSWLFDKRLDPVPAKDDIVSAYIKFISTIRKKYANSYILCTLGTMDAIAPGKPWPDYIKKAVQIMKNMGDSNIDAFIFSYQGYDKHPRVVHHVKMADELTQFLKQKMKW